MSNKQLAIKTLSSTNSCLSNVSENLEKQLVISKLNPAIRTMSIVEKNLRDSTITLNTRKKTQMKELIELINDDWKAFKPFFWHNETNLHIKFSSNKAKLEFLRKLALTSKRSKNITLLMTRPNNFGHHFKRKLIQLKIETIKSNIQPSDIIKILLNYEQPYAVFIEPIEIRTVGSEQIVPCKTIYFKTNGAGFHLIFAMLNGLLGISSKKGFENIMLDFKLSVKPLMCTDCFQISSTHICNGRICLYCGSKNHIKSNCTSAAKCCSNCKLARKKARGHCAQDVYCPVFIDAIVKELQELDIPIQFFEDETLRQILINSLILF